MFLDWRNDIIFRESGCRLTQRWMSFDSKIGCRLTRRWVSFDLKMGVVWWVLFNPKTSLSFMALFSLLITLLHRFRYCKCYGKNKIKNESIQKPILAVAHHKLVTSFGAIRVKWKVSSDWVTLCVFLSTKGNLYQNAICNKTQFVSKHKSWYSQLSCLTFSI